MKLYNTMSRALEAVRPIHNNTIGLYTCGPTVYHYAQIGNWTTYVRWDVLVRALRANGYKVTWVMNITDVGHLTSDADEGEDKLEKGARREGKTAWEVATFYTDDFVRGMNQLNILPPTLTPKATEHIAEQIALIQKLETKGYTYTIDDGVYFDTAKLPDYGKLARLKLHELKEGARVEINRQKHSPTDFALWKFSPKDAKRDMEWESPWGKGFPGWHLECSAMAMKYLGETIDIHAGGIDFIPVHHTNEIAQSEAATGKPFANIWLHGNFLTVDGIRLGKSLGNSYTLHDLAAKGYHPLDLRMLVLQSHYRTQADFTWEALGAGRARRFELYKFGQLAHQPNLMSNRGTLTAKALGDYQAELRATVSDDLNTPLFLAMIGKLEGTIRRDRLKDSAAFTAFQSLVRFIDDILGLGIADQADLTAEQKELLKTQDHRWHFAKARKADFASADKLRQQLLDQHITVSNYEDSEPLWARNP